MAQKRYGDQNGRNDGINDSSRKFMERFEQATQGEQPDWGRIDPELIWRLLQKCTQNDGAVMFGYSRDGGSYSLKIYAGGEPRKAYFHKDAELVDFVQYLIEE